MDFVGIGDGGVGGDGEGGILCFPMLHLSGKTDGRVLLSILLLQCLPYYFGIRLSIIGPKSRVQRTYLCVFEGFQPEY